MMRNHIKIIVLFSIFVLVGIVVSCCMDCDCPTESERIKPGDYIFESTGCNNGSTFPGLESAQATVGSDQVIIEFEGSDVRWTVVYNIL